jgi:shikimate dehydrogenase
MADRYAVIGHPIHHSKSPWIHAAFARQTGEAVEYTAVMGELDAFEDQVAALRADGLRGLNVTLPFKQRALALSTVRSPRSARAGAANTLSFSAAGIDADNTDGIGLMRDLHDRLGVATQGRRLLVLGAGGAVRGILGPLLATRPACLHLWNRTAERASALAAGFADGGSDAASAPVALAALAGAGPYDLVVNGTSGSLSGAALPLPESLFAPTSFAYDLAYRPDGDTPFLAQARAAGAHAGADGLGMLVEQAAEAFLLWRGIRPDTNPVLEELRARLPSAQ